MICNPIYPHECAYNNPLGSPLSPPSRVSFLLFLSYHRPTFSLYFSYLHSLSLIDGVYPSDIL